MSAEPWPLRHPYIFAVLLVVTVMLAGVVAVVVADILEASVVVHWSAMNVVLALLGVVMLQRLGWWRRVGFRRSDRPGMDFLLWLPLCPILVWNLTQIHTAELVSAQRMLLWLAITALAAFVEEVYFRGLMLRALESRGLWKAAIVSAALFGAMHVFNILAGADRVIVAGQTAYATAIGFAYAAYVLHTGLIWPVILVHALANFADLMDQETLIGGEAPGEADLVRWSIYVVFFAVYGIWVLKRTNAAEPEREAGI